MKMTAKKLRRLSPQTLAYSMAGSSMSADDQAWVREVYSDFPEGCGWHWDEKNNIPRSDQGGEWWTPDTTKEQWWDVP
jgi:hypothetical protein